VSLIEIECCNGSRLWCFRMRTTNKCTSKMQDRGILAARGSISLEHLAGIHPLAHGHERWE
jgi:hypothetical protein